MILAVYEFVRWSFWSHDIWHPLYGNGYQFWSGIMGATAIFGATFVALRHLECHEAGCHRHGKYLIEGGIRCCSKHHPALDERPHEDRGVVHKLHRAHLDLHRSHHDPQRTDQSHAGGSGPAETST